MAGSASGSGGRSGGGCTGRASAILEPDATRVAVAKAPARPSRKRRRSMLLLLEVMIARIHRQCRSEPEKRLHGRPRPPRAVRYNALISPRALDGSAQRLNTPRTPLHPTRLERTRLRCRLRGV